MVKSLILTALGMVAALALSSCGPTSSSALRHNDGIPIYGFGGGGYSSGSSAPC